MAHLQPDTIENYAFRRLPEDQTVRVETHLLLCQSCRERLEEFDGFRRAIRDYFRAQPSVAQQ
jgi:hypothetical protein